jgi:hypothetical protein
VLHTSLMAARCTVQLCHVDGVLGVSFARSTPVYPSAILRGSITGVCISCSASICFRVLVLTDRFGFRCNSSLSESHPMIQVNQRHAGQCRSVRR